MKQLHPRAVWLFFLSTLAAWIFGGFVLSGSVVGYFIKNIEASDNELLWLRLVPIIVFVLILIVGYVVARLRYRFYKYELTENEYKAERGIIAKRYISIPYERIQNVDIRRGLISRLLGLSDLQIQTAGSTSFRSEGRLPGLAREDAEVLRDELIRRTKQSSRQIM